MTKTELAEQIRAVSYLTGEFVLRSGNISNFYWDKYRFESDPALLAAIAEEMAKLLPSECDGLAGLELGGIPLATALSLQTGLPCFYVRKEAKTYGTCNLIEGGVAEGSTLVVIEDVITTAGQVCTSIEQIRAEGYRVEHVVAAIDRQAGGATKINALGCSFASVFTLADL
ncbi:orotate phosphoribosyltransferase [Candidatus Poribacteria bacterium]|nr:orotate phosphoribosyltransferase [Candidatus Poribacteria bacterium]